MKLLHKSFPKLQIFICLCIFFSSCSEERPVIEDAKFVEFYARLLIINEMQINDEKHDQLVEKLMQEYQISSEALKQTLKYYNEYPEKWVEILSKIRTRLNEIKDKQRPKSK
jgi:hypothetical protein